jgi:hypothetical protein
MRALSPFIADLSQRPAPRPRTPDCRPEIWITLGCIVYCIAFWSGVGLGLHALVTPLLISIRSVHPLALGWRSARELGDG